MGSIARSQVVHTSTLPVAPATADYDVCRIAAESPQGDGLYAFQVQLPSGQGRCYITAAQALHLQQLTTRWVARALTNLAIKHGRSWVEQAMRSVEGLQLHHDDAADILAQD